MSGELPKNFINYFRVRIEKLLTEIVQLVRDYF